MHDRSRVLDLALLEPGGQLLQPRNGTHEVALRVLGRRLGRRDLAQGADLTRVEALGLSVALEPDGDMVDLVQLREGIDSRDPAENGFEREDRYEGSMSAKEWRQETGEDPKQ